MCHNTQMPSVSIYLQPKVIQQFTVFSARFAGQMGKAFGHILHTALHGSPPTRHDYQPKNSDLIEAKMTNVKSLNGTPSHDLFQAYDILCNGNIPPLEARGRAISINIPAHLFHPFNNLASEAKLKHGELARNIIHDFFGVELERKNGLTRQVEEMFDKLYDQYGFKELPDLSELQTIFNETTAYLMDTPLIRAAYKEWNK